MLGSLDLFHPAGRSRRAPSLSRPVLAPVKANNAALRLIAATMVTLALVSAPAKPANAADIVIATGDEDSLYDQVGRAMCHFLRRHSDGLACLPLRTPAGDTTISISNLNNVRGGAVEFGLARADAQFHAVEHSGPFEFMDITHENLRSVFSLYSQDFTLLARRDAGIESANDLAGRRVNIGAPQSETRRLMEQVMAIKGLTKSDFLLAEELPAAQQTLAFCFDRIEAMPLFVAHPDTVVNRVTDLCDAVLIDVNGAQIDELVGKAAYFTPVMAPGGIYAGNGAAVQTFGVTATLISSDSVDEDTVYQVVKTVFENLDALKTAHPVLHSLNPGRMVSEGLSAPVHEGALRYYRERGLN